MRSPEGSRPIPDSWAERIHRLHAGSFGDSSSSRRAPPGVGGAGGGVSLFEPLPGIGFSSMALLSAATEAEVERAEMALRTGTASRVDSIDSTLNPAQARER